VLGLQVYALAVRCAVVVVAFRGCILDSAVPRVALFVHAIRIHIPFLRQARVVL
jgi:hypothetical protein